MTFQTFLKLGRVSNLPTVWTNALARTVLAGNPSVWPVVIVGIALTLFYTGGMWLNDAFDAQIDAEERKNRPIPMGEIAVGTVFAVGYAMLGAGVLEKIVEDVARQKPDHVHVSGDLMNVALPGEFETGRRFLEALEREMGPADNPDFQKFRRTVWETAYG